MPKPTTKSAARYDIVLGELMDAAERLFAQKGVKGTSLSELADAVGLTRTGIYHYISGKDEMLETLVEGFTRETALDLQRLVKNESSPALDRLRRGVHNMALKVAQKPQRFRLLLTSESAFPETLAKQHRLARRQTLSALTELVTQAITEGSCRPVDPHLAAFSLLGVANWVAFWYPGPEGLAALPVEELASQLTDIALRGLITDRASPEGDGVSHVLGLLQEDLDRLGQMLKTR